MFKEITILLCIVAVAWTQSCSPAPSPTSGFVEYTTAAQWAGQILSSNTSTNRNCVSISAARSIRSASGNYECRLFTNSNCSTAHSSFYADSAGWSNTGSAVNGITCPWWCYTADNAGDDARDTPLDTPDKN